MLLCYTIINKEEEATTMAKATITYTCKVCGETATASTTKHNRRDADAWEAWAIDHYDTCPDCYRKMQEQAMADKAAELAKLYSLPEITGLSQKQIDYAADLRAKYIAKNKQMCDAMQQMFTKFDYAQINTLAAQNNLTPDEYIKKSLQNDPNWGIVYTMLKVFDAKEIIEFAKGK